MSPFSVTWHKGLFLSALILLSSHVTATTQQLDPELRKKLAAAMASETIHFDRFDAEVWLADMSHRLNKLVKDPQERAAILKFVYIEAAEAKLDPELVLAVIHIESRFDRFAISKAGARGLMQIMPFWLDEIGHKDDNLFNIQTNLRFGCTILRYYLDKEEGNRTRALARYNGSLGSNRYPDKVLGVLKRHWIN